MKPDDPNTIMKCKKCLCTFNSKRILKSSSVNLIHDELSEQFASMPAHCPICKSTNLEEL